MLDLLRDEYARSVELLSSARPRPRRDPEEHLGGHLLAFYLHGRLALDDALLVGFFQRASAEVRSRALANIGQGIRGQDSEPLGGDVASRIKALWDWRIDIAQAGQSGEYEGEAAAFGWTFASGNLGDVWALEQLEATLGIAGQTDVDHLVAERLVALAENYPGEVAHCFGLMVEGAKETWQIHHWAGELETALGAALRSGAAATVEAATALIHLLGARGFLQFAKLLKDS